MKSKRRKGSSLFLSRGFKIKEADVGLSRGGEPCLGVVDGALACQSVDKVTQMELQF